MTLHRQNHELVSRLLKGEEQAFEAFFRDHYSIAYRFSLRRMRGDESAAEEVAQATLCTALRRIETYRGEAALLTWVLTICRREIVDWYRAHGRHAAEVSVEDLDNELAAALDSLMALDDNPEEQAQRAEVRERIQLALDRLRPRQRQALHWKYLEGQSVREISASLEVTEKAAESLLTRARSSFREAYLLLEKNDMVERGESA